MDSRNSLIRGKIDAIEAEMRRIGMWSATPPPSEAFEDMGPFGANTMAFGQWLQFVLIPNVRGLLETEGPWPQESMVGPRARREFDGIPEAGPLIRLLNELDLFFQKSE